MSPPNSEQRDIESSKQLSDTSNLEHRLSINFDNKELLSQALRHRSWCAEHDGVPSNERLEYLGDAVISLVVAEHTYHLYPDLQEGKLAKVRAMVVNTDVLADVAREHAVGTELKLSRGENQSGGRQKTSILADTMEAVIGAYYLDQGFDSARALIVGLLTERIGDAVLDPGVYDAKSLLQEFTLKRHLGTPLYSVEGSGPDHERTYSAVVHVQDHKRGKGEGKSKKGAEQRAARVALDALAAQIGHESRGDDDARAT